MNTSTSNSSQSSAVEDPLGELATVEQEVERVSAMLSRLVIRRHTLKERINELYSPFIRMLPLEIVSEIFASCLPPFDSSIDYTTSPSSPSSTSSSSESSSSSSSSSSLSNFDISFSPFLFGAVCSSWRRIAWSTPALWATLTFRLVSPIKIHSQAVLVEEWLSRSGQMPLSIRLTSIEDASWTGVSTEGLMKAIGKYGARWKNLDIRLPSACYKYLPTIEDADKFPLLSTLILRPPGGQGDRVHRVNIPISPRLRYLSLSCLYLRSVVFHFGVLTHMDLESFYIDELLEMLRQSTALVKFTAKKVLGGDDRHDMPEAPILLENLEEICIVNDKGAEIQVLLDKITTPKLRSFSYTSDNLMAMPAAEFVAFIRRSGCFLDTLSVLLTPLRDQALQILLPALPSLTSFILSMPMTTSTIHSPLTDGILQMLDPTYAAANKVSCSLPRLRSFSYSGGQGFTWPIFLRVLESRCPSVETKIEKEKGKEKESSSSHQTSSQDLISLTTDNCVSFIRNVQLTLLTIPVEDGSPLPEWPCEADLDSLGHRGMRIELHDRENTRAYSTPNLPAA